MGKIPDVIPDFTRSDDGLIPAIAQDYETGKILMLAYVNREAWEETIKTGRATYWTRSRSKLWKKGEESGNFQVIKKILVDCDGDSIIYQIEQKGGIACHTGRDSCFYNEWNGTDFDIISKPIKDPKDIYK